MEIISHRGYWKSENEKNLPLAFSRSFDLGFGTETDLRDYSGAVVISHDIPNHISLNFNAFLEIYKAKGEPTTLALNVKSDGLQKLIMASLAHYNISNYFLFDMSVPDTIGYIKDGLKFFTRQSEYEPIPAFYEKSDGVWLDSFDGIWFGEGLILDHLNKGKKVAIVSPELHKRDHEKFWGMLKSSNIYKLAGVILCTDFPEVAREYFD
jgi:aspartate carbamoyltransferase regulatory subunit